MSCHDVAAGHWACEDQSHSDCFTNRHWMIVVDLQRRRIASSSRLCVLDSRLASHGVERSLLLANELQDNESSERLASLV